MRITPQAMAAEKSAIETALQIARGNVSLAARSIGMTHRTAWRRIREFGISPDHYRQHDPED